MPFLPVGHGLSSRLSSLDSALGERYPGIQLPNGNSQGHLHYQRH